jgi:hypothetical protein
MNIIAPTPLAATDINGHLYAVREVVEYHDGEYDGLVTVVAEPLGQPGAPTGTFMVLAEDVRIHPLASFAVVDAANWADDKREQEGHV